MKQELMHVNWAAKSSLLRWKDTTVSKEFMDYLDARKKNPKKIPPQLSWKDTEIYLAEKKESVVAPFKNYMNNLKEKNMVMQDGLLTWMKKRNCCLSNRV
ncbi:hypothetical protein Hdeb2414_s0005g00171621 [Helianthus debilis subsp. tardiflorus]